MLNFAVLFLFLQILPVTILAKSKYTDETRPYEFGFNIEGQQHRKEKKDENGLIMGEFGFITADGVYHVTVYATDENGNFKILSMKNIRLGPAPDVTPPPLLVLTPSLPPVLPSFPNSPPNEQYSSPSSPRPIAVAPAKPIASCSHCSIPSTTQRNPPSNYYQQGNPSANLEAPFQNNPNYQQNQGFQQDQPQGQNQFYPQDPSYSQNGQFPQGQNQPPYQNRPLDQQTGPSTQGPTYANPSDNFNPILISAVMRPVDNSALLGGLAPGERPGLPAGVTERDMEGLLYRFNYTLGFHGHREEGYTNGAKKGEYFVNNRNGLATKVSYVADDTGFHPKISTVKLSEVETPKEETEKSDEFGLKGYEFTWFYVPKYHYLNQQ